MTCGREVESFRSSFASCPPCFVPRAQSQLTYHHQDHHHRHNLHHDAGPQSSFSKPVSMPCYTRYFFLQLATQQTLHCRLPKKFTSEHAIFATCNASKCCVASCKKVELSSTFRNAARQVAAFDMQSAICNAIC